MSGSLPLDRRRAGRASEDAKIGGGWPSNSGAPSPNPVSVLHRSGCLWASVHEGLTDPQVIDLQRSILAMVAEHDARTVIVDVGGLDVIDSFVARALTAIARSNTLRGARTYVVGIRPEVADAMSRFGLRLDDTTPAIDVDAVLEVVGRPPR